MALSLEGFKPVWQKLQSAVCALLLLVLYPIILLHHVQLILANMNRLVFAKSPLTWWDLFTCLKQVFGLAFVFCLPVVQHWQACKQGQFSTVLSGYWQAALQPYSAGLFAVIVAAGLGLATTFSPLFLLPVVLATGIPVGGIIALISSLVFLVHGSITLYRAWRMHLDKVKQLSDGLAEDLLPWHHSVAAVRAFFVGLLLWPVVLCEPLVWFLAQLGQHFRAPQQSADDNQQGRQQPTSVFKLFLQYLSAQVVAACLPVLYAMKTYYAKDISPESNGIAAANARCDIDFQADTRDQADTENREYVTDAHDCEALTNMPHGLGLLDGMVLPAIMPDKLGIFGRLQPQTEYFSRYYLGGSIALMTAVTGGLVYGLSGPASFSLLSLVVFALVVIVVVASAAKLYWRGAKSTDDPAAQLPNSSRGRTLSSSLPGLFKNRLSTVVEEQDDLSLEAKSPTPKPRVSNSDIEVYV